MTLLILTSPLPSHTNIQIQQYFIQIPIQSINQTFKSTQPRINSSLFHHPFDLFFLYTLLSLRQSSRIRFCRRPAVRSILFLAVAVYKHTKTGIRALQQTGICISTTHHPPTHHRKIYTNTNTQDTTVTGPVTCFAPVLPNYSDTTRYHLIHPNILPVYLHRSCNSTSTYSTSSTSLLYFYSHYYTIPLYHLLLLRPTSTFYNSQSLSLNPPPRAQSDLWPRHHLYNRSSTSIHPQQSYVPSSLYSGLQLPAPPPTAVLPPVAAVAVAVASLALVAIQRDVVDQRSFSFSFTHKRPASASQLTRRLSRLTKTSNFSFFQTRMVTEDNREI